MGGWRREVHGRTVTHEDEPVRASRSTSRASLGGADGPTPHARGRSGVVAERVPTDEPVRRRADEPIEGDPRIRQAEADPHPIDAFLLTEGLFEKKGTYIARIHDSPGHEPGDEKRPLRASRAARLHAFSKKPPIPPARSPRRAQSCTSAVHGTYAISIRLARSISLYRANSQPTSSVSRSMSAG